MGTEKHLIYMEDAIAKIVDTPSSVATMAFEGYYGFIQNPANILAARQHEIIDLLEAVSTVDAVEVVRCKDCKHTRKKSAHEQFMYNENVCICTKEDIWGITKNEPVWDDWFCSCGERKDND